MDWTHLRQKSPLIVAGFDPGTATMGFGVVARVDGKLHHVDHGALKADRTASISARLLTLSRGLEAVLAHHRPDAVVVEEAFVKKNPQSALRLGEVRGVILLSAERLGIATWDYPTATVKRSVTGHGGAEKSLVQTYVAQSLALAELPTPTDASDALALCLCFFAEPGLDPRYGAAFG